MKINKKLYIIILSICIFLTILMAIFGIICATENFSEFIKTVQAAFNMNDPMQEFFMLFIPLYIIFTFGPIILSILLLIIDIALLNYPALRIKNSLKTEILSINKS